MTDKVRDLEEQVKAIAQDATTHLKAILGHVSRAGSGRDEVAARCAGHIRRLRGDLEGIAAEFDELAARGDDAEVAI